MEEEKIRLKFEGPFTWFGDESIFCSKSATEKGVYLQTFPHNDAYLVYYVGTTNKSFLERFQQHLSNYLTGCYHIYDCSALKNAEKKVIFKGWGNYKLKEGRLNEKMNYLAHRVEDFMPKIISLLNSMQLFTASLNVDRRQIERIEAMIAKQLKKTQYNFQYEGVTYRAIQRDGESSIIVVVENNNLLGLDPSKEINSQDFLKTSKKSKSL